MEVKKQKIEPKAAKRKNTSVDEDDDEDDDFFNTMKSNM
jgi:hypothetical protein